MIVTRGMYDKEFKFDNNGKEESIIIKPLTTKHLPKLFSIIKVLQDSSIKDLQIKSTDTEDVKTSKQEKLSARMMEVLLEPEILTSVIEVVSATVEKSYPTMESEPRDEFIATNMFTLLPFIFEVNFRKK